MTPIILLANNQDKIVLQVENILKSAEISLITPWSIDCKQSGQIAVVCDKVITISACRGVVVALNGSSSFRKLSIPRGFVGICRSEDSEALELFEKHKTPVITCGMSATDTVTLSSVSARSACVCLQRTLNRFGLEPLEPCEIPLHLECEYLPESVMLALAVLLFCGKQDKLKSI